MSTDELAPEYSDPERAMSKMRSARSTKSATEDSEQPVRGARATRSGVNGISIPRKRTYNDIDGMSDEEDAEPSGDEWDSDKNEDDDEKMADADDESEEDAESDDEDNEPRSLVVTLKLSPEIMQQATNSRPAISIENGTATPPTASDEPAEPGATKQEPTVHNEAHTVPMPYNSEAAALLAQQPGSSPTGPSPYPTPTSTSFVNGEQKAMVASAAPVSNGHLPPMQPQYMPNGQYAPTLPATAIQQTEAYVPR
jgi:hypothetical protein